MTPLARLLVSFVVVACAAALTATFDLPRQFGAHPWWSIKSIWLGAPAGLLLALAAWVGGLSQRLRLLGFSGLSALAFTAAKLGQTRFAASYAEDALAGQMWYFGWIATCAFVAAIQTSVFWPTRQKH